MEETGQWVMGLWLPLATMLDALMAIPFFKILSRAGIPALLGNGLVVQTHVIERCICGARTDRRHGWLHLGFCSGRGAAGTIRELHLRLTLCLRTH